MEKERETGEEGSKDMRGAARRYIPIEASRWMTKTRGREAPPCRRQQKKRDGKNCMYSGTSAALHRKGQYPEWRSHPRRAAYIETLTTPTPTTLAHVMWVRAWMGMGMGVRLGCSGSVQESMAGGRRSIGREHAGGRWQTADRARVQPGHRLSHPLGGGTGNAMQESDTAAESH